MGTSAIMIIDDDAIFQFITKKMIDKIAPECAVLQFPDGKYALEFIKESRINGLELPNLLFLDINMPLVNGWVFLEQFSGNCPEGYSPTIYMVSSSDDPVDVERAGKNDLITSYLTKPITPTKLKAIIQEIKTDSIE